MEGWTEILVRWVPALSALLTPMIAVAVAFIAYQQWRTANAKVVLDLFEKRLAVYGRVRSAVSTVNGRGKSDREADANLLEAIDAAEFLFGPDVTKYLADMWERFCRLQLTHSQLQSDDEEVRGGAAQQQMTLLQDITNFYYEGADVFAPYMRMEHRLRKPLKCRRTRPRSPNRVRTN